MALAVAAAFAALAPAQGLALTGAQRFFSSSLQKDSRVGAEVRRHLREGDWHIDKNVVFADVTGDGKSDAVVRVLSGTSAGDVAAYVFSSKPGRRLRAVFLKEDLYRVTVSARGGLLRLTVPSFGAGNPTCCPSRYLERSYRWRGTSFVLTATRMIRAPLPRRPPA